MCLVHTEHTEVAEFTESHSVPVVEEYSCVPNYLDSSVNRNSKPKRTARYPDVSCVPDYSDDLQLREFGSATGSRRTHERRIR